MIAHIADTHLGYRQFNRIIQKDILLNVREYDVFQSFIKALDLCEEAGVGTVLIAGDMFHNVRPSNWTIQSTIKALNDYDSMEFVIIGGNHDTPLSSETAHILETIKRTTCAEVAYNEPRILEMRNLVIRMEPIRPQGMNIQIPSDAEFLLIHGVHPKFDRNSNSQWYLPKGSYDPGYWKYIAWGDSHDYQKMGPNEYYAGSLDYCSSSSIQERQTKGFNLIDNGAVSRITYPVREHIRIESNDESEIEQRIKSAIERCEFEFGPVIKVKSANQSIVKLKEYRKSCLNLSFEVEVVEQVKSKFLSWVEFSKPYGEAVTQLGNEYMS